MILPFVFVVLLYFSASGKEEITFHHGCETFTIQDSRVLLNTSVADNRKSFNLDLGRTESGIYADINQTPRILKIGNSLFSGEKKFIPLQNTSVPCGKTNNTDGYFGYDIFRKSRQIFHLDFNASTLCCVTELQKSTLLNADYQEIKSDFRKDNLYITIIIKRKLYSLKFDTGYNGTILMTRNDAQPFVKNACKSYQSVDGDFSIYPNKWVTIGDSYYNSAVSVADASDSKIGVGFLKGFNWIIDFRAQKVYVRKNSVGIDAENTFPPDLQAKAVNGELTVICKNANNTKINLGSVITKINGIPVAKENICEMRERLESCRNTNALDIEFFTAN
jgi:hypothetical protein